MNLGALRVRAPVTTNALDSVRSAAARMAAQDVGALVVTDEKGRPEGVLTDRDVVVRCVSEGLAPEDTPVGDVMTDTLVTVSEDEPIEAALVLMADRAVRRLVVVDGSGRVSGVVTLDDLLVGIVDRVDEVGRLLRRQVRI